MEILVVSYNAPCANSTAGQKTHRHYLIEMKKAGYNPYLVSFCDDKDRDKLNLDKIGIDNTIFFESHIGWTEYVRKIKRALRIVFYPNEKYATFVSPEQRSELIDALKDYQEQGHHPECIILEWTHMILLVEIIKKYFPDILIIASSHDVNYVGSKRFWENEENMFVKYFRKRQYLNLKRREVDALSQCDMIVPQNDNDILLLKQNESLKSKSYHRIVPYYEDFSDIIRKPALNTIVFYGAMGRSENQKSVHWFVKNVFKRLEGGFRFIIIGGGVTKEIRKYESADIEVTGFLPIEKVREYFSTAVCMVAPLRLGSGIKVKILEAFSAGIPVLTNDIGIEGIYAVPNVNYIHCESADDYIRVFKDIKDGRIDIEQIGRNSRKFVYEKHSLERSTEGYMNLIESVSHKA